jgi:hypothetical protein
MVTKSRLLDHLLSESRKNCELHPYLKRVILATTQAALQHVVPESYHKKCHGAAIAIFMLLRTLRIRAAIMGGSVSWLYGTVSANGVASQTRCGYWSQNPNLPTPHTWVVTEFGGLIDLTCSYFHRVHNETEKSVQSRDVLPIIWMKTENLAALPSLRYAPAARFETVDLDQCDELARDVVRNALVNFWSQPWLEIEVPADGDTTGVAGLMQLPDLGNEMLDGAPTLERLRQSNGWVARNCAAPSAHALTMRPE